MGVSIKDYPMYEINTDGSVFSKWTNKFLKPSKNTKGYYSVELFNDVGSRRFLVHRLVAQAFIENPNNYPQINHIDENPSNNDVSNLEWCTSKYNMNYGNGAKTRHQKIDYTTVRRKEVARQNGEVVSRPIYQYTKNGCFLRKYPSIKAAADSVNKNPSHIGECARGERFSAYGYMWKFERSDDLSVFQF